MLPATPDRVRDQEQLKISVTDYWSLKFILEIQTEDVSTTKWQHHKSVQQL